MVKIFRDNYGHCNWG